MSVHDPLATRKPPREFRRLGLYLPFLLLLVAIAVWSAFWIWARGQVLTRLDAAVRSLGHAGYELSWSQREVGGYPFRLDVTLGAPRLREASGWGLDAPVLEAEAYLFAPGHWMFAAPQGLTLVRPEGGAVAVNGKVLHASLTNLDKRPPSFSFQGQNLIFQPARGAAPFALSAADLFELHLRPGPDDQGGVFVQLTNGKAQLSGLLARIAGEKPVSLAWNSTLSRMSAFEGADWADAVRRWTEAGGLMTVRDGQLVAGDALFQARSGTLGADHDGRLSGVLEVALRQAPRALGAMAAAGLAPKATADAASAVVAARQDGDVARVSLHFQAGQTTLGPVALGPAPKVYTPR
jgi:hypothetical protein